jgi:hypothetical protein
VPQKAAASRTHSKRFARFVTRFKVRTPCAVMCALLVVSARAFAMSGTDQIAWPGKPVAAERDWPAGVVELVNDPTRTEGWSPWFSEWPNDVKNYTFHLQSAAEANRLLKEFAAIKAPKLQLRLNPGKEPRGLGFSTVLKEGNTNAALFSIGSQARINEWYQHLAESKPGVRKFGVHELTEPPAAMPPTLTLYVANPAINLQGLEIPDNVEVVANTHEAGKANPEDAPRIQAIEQFIADHRKKAAAQSANVNDHLAWVEQCLKDFASLKPGMTRKEVESKFPQDGGLQTVSPVRYTHPACPCFKIDVEFDFKRDQADQGRAITGADDKVTRVSRPYLERPISD